MFSLLGLLKLAASNLRTNRLRSSLTVLGMVFGTGAVIATLSSSEGAARYIQSELEKLGTNVITVRSGSDASFRESDKDLLKKYADSLESVSLVHEIIGADARYGSRVFRSFLFGVDSSYFDLLRLNIHRGRIFDPAENNAGGFVALLGHGTKKELFGAQNAIGEFLHLYVGEISLIFEVIGVLKEKGGPAGHGVDSGVFIASRTAAKIAPDKMRTSFLAATLVKEDASLKAKIQTQKLFARRFPAGLQISDAREAIERTQEIWKKQNLVGICLAIISLLTGGVGIMNIMLLSVTLRRKEIGLRKAVGANDTHILIQFLLEAVIVCLCGGILGIILGMLFGQQVARLMGQWNAVLSVSTILCALGFATLTGIFFGLLPALRASRMDPYDALRT